MIVLKILVTGGAGFIGSNFIYYLRKESKDYKIVCLDKLTYAGNLCTLKELVRYDDFKFIVGDICDRKLVFELFEQENFDIVINFAAETHVDRSIENPTVFLETNILGTQVLMDACIKFNVQRFHQVSTDEVYGDLPIERKDLLFNESSKIATSSPYSASKAAADLLVLAYHRTYGLPTTISRCSNNYGAFQYPEKLIPLMIKKALNNEKLPIYGDGKNIRDWLNVEDHCCALNLIINKGEVGQIYNVGGNNEKSNNEVVKIILKQLNKSVDQIVYVKDRAGHDLRYAIDSTKISKELGWKPKVKFEEGIRRTIKWYLENQAWVEKVIK